MSHHLLLDNNRHWVREQKQRDPEFFERLAKTHAPKYLWIGCSDARVPADAITGTTAGEIFVQRNIANLVVATDNNLLAVLQYAVEVLKVQDVIVCGHYGCGGVRASLGPTAPSYVETWLAHVRLIARLHADELEAIPDIEMRARRLVELNAVEQVHNVARTHVVQSAWAAGMTLRIHGWVYAIEEGVLRDLDVTLDGSATVPVAPGQVTQQKPVRPAVADLPA